MGYLPNINNDCLIPFVLLLFVGTIFILLICTSFCFRYFYFMLPFYDIEDFFDVNKNVLSDCNRIQTYNHLFRKTNTQPFNQTSQMMELCCEKLSMQCSWLYVIIMSLMRFRVNPHFIVA